MNIDVIQGSGRRLRKSPGRRAAPGPPAAARPAARSRRCAAHQMQRVVRQMRAQQLEERPADDQRKSGGSKSSCSADFAVFFFIVDSSAGDGIRSPAACSYHRHSITPEAYQRGLRRSISATRAFSCSVTRVRRTTHRRCAPDSKGNNLHLVVVRCTDCTPRSLRSLREKPHFALEGLGRSGELARDDAPHGSSRTSRSEENGKLKKP